MTYLDFHRETLAQKCAGLSDDDLRRRTAEVAHGRRIVYTSFVRAGRADPTFTLVAANASTTSASATS